MSATETPKTPNAKPSPDAVRACRYWYGHADAADFDGMEEPGEVEAYDLGLLGCGRDGRYFVTGKAYALAIV